MHMTLYPALLVGRLVGGPILGSSPKGVDDLCFHTYGEFCPSPPPGIGSHGWDLDLLAEILALRLGYGPPG